MIQDANKIATINLEIKESLDVVSLPKEILQTAKENNITLTVNVSIGGKINTWIFPIIDNAVDVNLAMNVISTSNFESLKGYDGLVLAFNHNGVLSTILILP